MLAEIKNYLKINENENTILRPYGKTLKQYSVENIYKYLKAKKPLINNVTFQLKTLRKGEQTKYIASRK